MPLVEGFCASTCPVVSPERPDYRLERGADGVAVGRGVVTRSGNGANASANRLYFGNNFDWLQLIEPDTVDLVYLDPPFNSKAQYNLLYETPDNERETAQRTVFRDTWTWTKEAEFCLDQCLAAGGRVASIMKALNSALQRSDTMAYLAMMAARLILIHRTLKPTGSLYLHCDPTASHYLKIILDAIFGPVNYRTEISWRRTSAHNDAKQGRRQYGNVRDIVFFYTATDEWKWNQQYTPYGDAYLSSAYRHEDPLTNRRYRMDNLTAAKPGGDVSYKWRIKRKSPNGNWEGDVADEFEKPKVGWEYSFALPYKGRYWAYSQDNMRQMERDGKIAYTKGGMPNYKGISMRCPVFLCKMTGRIFRRLRVPKQSATRPKNH